ncbi:SDR family NAD(P)-dependent oxidoreductase [Chondromyces crocatus]|uniref:Short-chain dehydrogenase n=1 Tax=Chondromyces crocatus TaxID=52 RepID=A0A0K1E689_CHOCO|nr:SDR family oxidoreductase [Chondromyces crocatus]AKT36063.1 short-chain dehydrogenase [Chondromyces crocatus]
MSLNFDGRTALITGASAGIGREIARVLARDVGALILVARRRERLDELAAELTAARPGLRVSVRAVDLLDRSATGEMLDALEREGEQVDIFVNNAGFGDHALFVKSGWTKTEQMLELNVVSATFLLHRLVPKMVARGFGAVLNVGSCAGIAPNPEMVAYSATKAFVNLLSDGLRAELTGTGVSVTNLSPGPVPTEFQEVSGSHRLDTIPKALHVEATQCAEEAVAGLKAGRARVIPGAPLRAAMVSLESVPKALVRPVLARLAERVKGRG